MVASTSLGIFKERLDVMLRYMCLQVILVVGGSLDQMILEVFSNLYDSMILVLGAPELNIVLQVGSHESKIEGKSHLPRCAGHASFDAVQDMVGFLGCKCTLQAYVKFVKTLHWALLNVMKFTQVQKKMTEVILNPFIMCIYMLGIGTKDVDMSPWKSCSI